MRSAAGPRTSRSDPRARPLPRTPAARGPRRSRRRRLLAHHRLRLLAHELLHVVGAKAVLAGAPRPLPATERLNPGPRPGRRAGPTIDVDHACLDPVQEAANLSVVAAEDARSEP